MDCTIYKIDSAPLSGFNADARLCLFRSDTVRLLHLRQCNISNEDMRSLQQALTENSIMQQIDIAENVADMEFVLEVEVRRTWPQSIYLIHGIIHMT